MSEVRKRKRRMKKMKNTEMKELNLKEMEMVNGGYLFKGDNGIEIIDDKTGDVLYTTRNLLTLYDIVDQFGVSSRFIIWEELARLRAGYQI